MNAAFALHWLNQHCGSLVSNGSFSGSQIIIWDVLVVRYERLERFAVLRLPGRGERTKRPSVETAHRSDDLLAACCQPRKFDGGLDSFRAAVAQERAGHFS